MSDASVQACVAVGANLGDAIATVQQALRELAVLPETQLVRASSLYRSAPYEAQGPDFINAAALIQTHLSPLALLHALQKLEQLSGRERPYKNAPRTLDMDVIFYGDLVLDSTELTLPHPRWQERAFVLLPLAEIWPQRVSAEQLMLVQDQIIQRIAF
jgi:2-amino-4-hydroxy-6-hydroxymethyldihydropteridine diphosphokinase